MAKKKKATKKAGKKAMSRGMSKKASKEKAPSRKKAARKAPARKKAARRATPLTERNLGDSWSSSDMQQLRQMISENTPTRVIGLKLGRTEESVYSKVSAMGLSLKPTNQSPMG